MLLNFLFFPLMEFKDFSFLHDCSQNYYHFFMLLFFTILFSLFPLVFYLHRETFLCKCDICKSYVTSSWSGDFKNLCDWYTHLLKTSPSQTIHIHALNNTITANPTNIEYMLKTNFENYPKGKPFSTILGDFLGKGIFNVDGDSWKFQRKMASLELGAISIRKFAFEIVTNEIKSRLIPFLSSVSDQENKILDLQEVFRRFSFDNICKFSFGLDPKCLESSLPISHFAEAFDLASLLSAKRATTTSPIVWKIKRLLEIGSERKLKEAIETVNALAMEVIVQKRKLGYSTHQDLLSRFMSCINDDIYLRDIVISFILAGRDTMASALTTFFWLLATHPEVVTNIRDEAGKLMESCPKSGSYDQIRAMHYLHATVYESLRLYPPVQFDSKFALEDDVLPDGTFVAKGTRVTYHPYAMGRMESIWGVDCMEFKPERWIKDGMFCPKCLFEYPVFQAGNRICLGKEMALMEMKMVALSVACEFDIQVVEPWGAPKFSPGLTAMLSGGLKVVIGKRQIATTHK